jgi:hypothetical protein
VRLIRLVQLVKDLEANCRGVFVSIDALPKTLYPGVEA